MADGHIDYTNDPQCIKCGFSGMDWKFKDVFIKHPEKSMKREYILLTCARCKFQCSMSCRDTLKIESYRED